MPYGKDVVKDSPEIADASHLDADEQQSLYSYYQRFLGNTGETVTGYGHITDRGDDQRDNGQGGAGYDMSGPNTDDAMTRSEEHLRVGTEQVEAGRA